MENIVKLKNSNYQETLRLVSEGLDVDLLKQVLGDVISSMPQKNEIVGKFMLDLLSSFPNLAQAYEEVFTLLMDSRDIETLTSAVFYAKRLGYSLNFEELKIDPLVEPTILLSLGEVEKIKILEYLERINQFVLETGSIGGDYSYFYCVSILKNFKFSPVECVRELQETSDVKTIFLAGVYLSDCEDPVYLSSVLLRVVSLDNYQVLLGLFEYMDKRFRDFFIALVHETYLIKKATGPDHPVGLPFEKDLETIRSFVDDETVDTLLRFVNVDNLSKFLPDHRLEVEPIKAIRKDEFSPSPSKDKFFRDFCLLGSPSVSHFLSYLEIYKDHFNLSDQDQKLFVDTFKKIFVNRKSFSRIVLDKMVLFKILDKKLV